MEKVRDVKVRWRAEIGLLGADEALVVLVALAAFVGTCVGVWIAGIVRLV